MIVIVSVMLIGIPPRNMSSEHEQQNKRNTGRTKTGTRTPMDCALEKPNKTNVQQDTTRYNKIHVRAPTQPHLKAPPHHTTPRKAQTYLD